MIKQVIIEDGCISCAICEQACPEVFEITDIAYVKPGVDFNLYEDKIKEAADGCPVSVIKIS